MKGALKDKNGFKAAPKCEYLLPEGGWGYIVAAATAIMIVSNENNSFH